MRAIEMVISQIRFDIQQNKRWLVLVSLHDTTDGMITQSICFGMRELE